MTELGFKQKIRAPDPIRCPDSNEICILPSQIRAPGSSSTLISLSPPTLLVVRSVSSGSHLLPICGLIRRHFLPQYYKNHFFAHSGSLPSAPATGVRLPVPMHRWGTPLTSQSWTGLSVTFKIKSRILIRTFKSPHVLYQSPWSASSCPESLREPCAPARPICSFSW